MAVRRMLALRRRRRIVVIATGDTHPRETLASALGSHGPAARNAMVIVALGPRWCQLRRLRGLPRLVDQRLARAAVRENASRFFLRLSGVMVTSGVDWTADDGSQGWSVAYDAELVDTLADVCRGAGATLCAVLPLERFEGWSEEQLARLTSSHPLAFARNDIPHGWRWWDRTLLASLAASALFCWSAPSLAPAAHHSDKAILTSSASSVPLTLVLARIVAMMPDSAHIASIRLDSSTAELHLAAPRVAVVLRSLDSLRGIRSMEMVGTVVSAASGSIHHERARLRLATASDPHGWAAESILPIPSESVSAPTRALAEARVVEMISDAALRDALALGGVELLRPARGSDVIRARCSVRGSFGGIVNFLAGLETGQPRLRLRQVALRGPAGPEHAAATIGPMDVQADFTIEAIASLRGRN